MSSEQVPPFTPETYAEVLPPTQNLFLHNEQGSIPVKFVSGALAIALVTGIGKGAYNWVQDALEQHDMTASSRVMHGSVTKTAGIGQQCIGLFQANVGASGTIRESAFLLDPEVTSVYIANTSRKVNGVTAEEPNLEAKICPKSDTFSYTVNFDAKKDEPKVIAKVAETTWDSDVYPIKGVNPSSFAVTKNVSALVRGAFSDYLRTGTSLFTGPATSANSNDAIVNIANGIALTTAEEYMITKCANPAWVTLKPQVEKQLKTEIEKTYKEYYPDQQPLTDAEIQVDLPSGISLSSQYTKEIKVLEDLQKQSGSSTKITFDLKNTPVCKSLATDTNAKVNN